MTEFVDVVLGGTFHAAVLFLVAAGLQLVFGVQKIVNLACGSFYALGAYFGITAVGVAIKLGMPPLLFFPVLIIAGLAIGLVGLPIERVLRTIYRRDESYQLLITFGFLLMFQDAFRYLWGATPRTMDNVYLAYGTAHLLGVRVPAYNLLVIAASLAIAGGLGLFLERTRTGASCVPLPRTATWQRGLASMRQGSSRWSSPWAACWARWAACWWCRPARRRSIWRSNLSWNP